MAWALALLVGVALGLLGGGGSILTVPLLVYGLDVEPKSAIASSLVVVGVTSLAAMIQHARAGHVVWRTGLLFGAAGMVGAFGGGLLAAYFSARVLLLLFAGMMGLTAVAMLRGGASEAQGPPKVPSVGLVIAEGVGVGVVTGLVGAGGGFLVVPALALLGGLTMQEAVGTSLLVITMKSFAGYLGHARHVDIDMKLTAYVVVAAVVGSLVGSALAGRVPALWLRRGFGVFVLGMAAFQVSQEL